MAWRSNKYNIMNTWTINAIKHNTSATNTTYKKLKKNISETESGTFWFAWGLWCNKRQQTSSSEWSEKNVLSWTNRNQHPKWFTQTYWILSGQSSVLLLINTCLVGVSHSVIFCFQPRVWIKPAAKCCMLSLIQFMHYVFPFVTVCQNKMQVDPEDQKQQTADNGDNKSETEDMEVTLCWAIRQNILDTKYGRITLPSFLTSFLYSPIYVLES